MAFACLPPPVQWGRYVLSLPQNRAWRNEPGTEVPLPVRDQSARLDYGQLLVVRQPDRESGLSGEPESRATADRSRDAHQTLAQIETTKKFVSVIDDLTANLGKQKYEVDIIRPNAGRLEMGAARRLRMEGAPIASCMRSLPQHAGIRRTIPQWGPAYQYYQPIRMPPPRRERKEMGLDSVCMDCHRGPDGSVGGSILTGQIPSTAMPIAEGDVMAIVKLTIDNGPTQKAINWNRRHPDLHSHHHRLPGDGVVLCDHPLCYRQAAAAFARRERRHQPRPYRPAGRYSHRRRIRGVGRRLQPHVARTGDRPRGNPPGQHHVGRQG